MEELQARHRKELRDLQSQVTQKKKQASKKTRKGVNDECERLETELQQRHKAEVAALNGVGAVDVPTEEQLNALTLQVDEEDKRKESNAIDARDRDPLQRGESVDHEQPVQGPGKKRNRAKERLARRAAQQEELSTQAAEEAKNLPDVKQQERERMQAYMKERGLQEKEIRADGHCLYSAVADQLEQLAIPLGPIPGEQPAIAHKVVRATAADYIQKHQDDFIPFIEEPMPDYLHKVRDTGEWGGQLELIALAKTYGTDINVLQDFGRVETIEGDSGSPNKDKHIWLGYYKHGFGLGEHYNSLRKALT